jgi:hypothetical protein
MMPVQLAPRIRHKIIEFASDSRHSRWYMMEIYMRIHDCEDMSESQLKIHNSKYMTVV